MIRLVAYAVLLRFIRMTYLPRIRIGQLGRWNRTSRRRAESGIGKFSNHESEVTLYLLSALMHHVVSVVQQSMVNDQEILLALLTTVYRSQLGADDLTQARPHCIRAT